MFPTKPCPEALNLQPNKHAVPNIPQKIQSFIPSAWLPRLVWVGVVMHFALLWWYCWPADNQMVRKERLAARYVEPTFYQQWSLFAPDVNTYQTKLSYRPLTAAGWGDWQYPAETEGWARRAVMARMHQSMVYDLGDFAARNWYVQDSVMRLDRITSDPLFQGAVFLCGRHHGLQNGALPDSVALRLDYLYFAKPGSGVADEPYELLFPASKTW